MISLKELDAPHAYQSEEMLENDKSYFLKKWAGQLII